MALQYMSEIFHGPHKNPLVPPPTYLMYSLLFPEMVHDYTSFEENFLGVLNKHTPLKKKVLRLVNVPYVTKALRKAIMKNSYLETLYLKKKSTKSLKV